MASNAESCDSYGHDSVSFRDASYRESISEENLRKLWFNIRSDGICLFSISLVSVILLWNQIDILQFMALFFIIDVIGYYPSLMLGKVNGNGVLPIPAYWLYNFFHSNSGGVVIAVSYCAILDGNPVNLIAITLHYGIDRGLLRNYIKNYGENI